MSLSLCRTSECAICQDPISFCSLAYRCGEEGRGVNRGRVHTAAHLQCETEWAQGKAQLNQENGRNDPIVCHHPGCNTDISYLLKPISLRAIDYLSKRPHIVMLATAVPLLGINIASGFKEAGVTAIGAIATAAAAAIVTPITAAAIPAVRAAGAGAALAEIAEAGVAGAAKVAGIVGAAAAAEATGVAALTGFVVAGAAEEGTVAEAAVGVAAIAGCVAGLAAGLTAEPRRTLRSAAAAVSVIAGASALINGSGIYFAGALSTLSGLFTYLTTYALGQLG